MTRRQGLTTICGVLAVWAVAATAWAAGPRVNVLKTPDGGIQPQALVDAKGTLHLIYFKGEPGQGDLFYVRREPGKEEFSRPIRVNSGRGSAVAMGTIRGGRLALGKNGRVHVAWNGSTKATQRSGGKYTAPMLYARLNDEGTAFEDERNLMQLTTTLDGGGTVAADGAGNVYVAWHGLKVGSPEGEMNRKVWLARSNDDGKTFSAEEAVAPKQTGVCGCCGMHAFTDVKGNLYLLYRSASENVNRDMYLLASRDRGKRFQLALLQKWSIGQCPMSSEAFAEGPGGVFGAWEAGGQVYYGKLDPAAAKAGQPLSAPRGERNRKHPALAINAKGEMLLAWAEGTGWQRGGSLAWQVYDKAGKPTAEKGRVDGGIPTWGLPAAVALPDGSFTVIH
jgi:hypothetical protein